GAPNSCSARCWVGGCGTPRRNAYLFSGGLTVTPNVLPASYLFSVRSAAVLGSSNVSTPKAQEICQVSPALRPAAPEDGCTPLNRYGVSTPGQGPNATGEFEVSRAVSTARLRYLPMCDRGNRVPHSVCNAGALLTSARKAKAS